MLLYKHTNRVHFILQKKNFFFYVLLIICLFKNILTSYFPCLTKVKFQLLKIQMNGLIGLKRLFLKSILNTTIINIFVMFKKLAMVLLGKFIVQIGKTRKIILH